MPRTPAKPLYRRIVSDALHISWHHKHLWVLGFFATLIGFGGVTEALFNAYDLAANGVPAALAAGRLGTLVPGLAALSVIASYSPSPGLAVAALLACCLILAAVFAWITIASAGGLLASIRKIARGGEPHLADGVRVGTDKFWPLFWVNLVGHAVGWSALIVTGGNLAAHLRTSGLTAGLFYVGSFVFGIIIAYAAALTAVFASIRVIAKDEPAERALHGGFAAVKAHWFVCVEVSLLLLVLGTAIGLALAAAVLVLAVPLIFLMALGSALGSEAAQVTVVTLTGLLLIIAVVAYGSFITTLQASAWMLLWEEFAEKPLPKLLRMLGYKKGRK